MTQTEKAFEEFIHALMAFGDVLTNAEFPKPYCLGRRGCPTFIQRVEAANCGSVTLEGIRLIGTWEKAAFSSSFQPELPAPSP